MHERSNALMGSFSAQVPLGERVLDVGSRDVNGTFRDHFRGRDYLGIDIQSGKNVDVVVEEYRYPFADESFRYIISGSTLEHVRRPWEWIKEVGRILAPGGKLCVIVPHTHPYHEAPVDCWRVFPDGLRELFALAGLTTLMARMDDGDHFVHPVLGEINALNDQFLDTIGVATK